MVIAVLIIADCPLLDTLLGHLQRNMDLAILTLGVVRTPSSRAFNAALASPLAHLTENQPHPHPELPDNFPCPFFSSLTARWINSFYIFLLQCLQFKKSGNVKEAPILPQSRIFRSGPDQDQGSVLNEG